MSAQNAEVRPDRRVLPLLLVAVVLIFPLQDYIDHRFGEPYPSLIMPSFAGDNTENGLVHITSVDIGVRFCDGSEAVLTPNELLEPLPASEIMAAMDWMFGPRERIPMNIPSWRRWIFEYVSPGYGKRVLRSHGESFIDDATKKWLSSAVATHSSGKIPNIVTMKWYRDTYVLGSVFPVRSRQLTSALPIQLACRY